MPLNAAGQVPFLLLGFCTDSLPKNTLSVVRFALFGRLLCRCVRQPSTPLENMTMMPVDFFFFSKYFLSFRQIRLLV